MSCKTTTTKKVLPAGKLFIGPADGSGEVLFAQVDSLTTSVATEMFEEYGGDGQLAELQIRKPTRVTRTGACTGKAITADNLARFFVANASTLTSTATPVVGESINAAAALVGGAWYQLGETTARPSGIRNVGSVTIKSDSGATTHVAGTAYVLDATLARFQVVAGGTLDGEAAVTADYTPVASTWEHIETTDDLSATDVRLRWVADNLEGDNRDLFCGCVNMTPSGDLQWKSAERNEVQALSFELSFLGPVYIDGRPVAS